ncbi:hypothetical protein N7523_006825 [Penicillium sp. IBT 18751x]|nr:hypothetical protein N7523_006825 [Penicillium sp. IBT 18751x]
MKAIIEFKPDRVTIAFVLETAPDCTLEKVWQWGWKRVWQTLLELLHASFDFWKLEKQSVRPGTFDTFAFQLFTLELEDNAASKGPRLILLRIDMQVGLHIDGADLLLFLISYGYFKSRAKMILTALILRQISGLTKVPVFEIREMDLFLGYGWVNTGSNFSASLSISALLEAASNLKYALPTQITGAIQYPDQDWTL